MLYSRRFIYHTYTCDSSCRDLGNNSQRPKFHDSS